MSADRIVPLISQEEIAAAVRRMGAQITRDMADAPPLTVLVVLKGSFVFAADLIRAIDLPLCVEFMGLSSYHGTTSSGVVRITLDLKHPIEGHRVLVVEDIVDTGLTLRFLLDNLRLRGPAELKLAALVHKPARTVSPVSIDYLGFSVPDAFVVGYGLDHKGQYRNLPFIGVLTPGT